MLDNCEHLIGACAKTADAILRRCPRVRLLATSREPLGIGGESIYRVPPLSLPGPGDVSPESCEAVALFVERVREQGVDLSVDEKTGPLLVSICLRLDGLPLAIELAAARLRSLSLISLRDRLDQRFRLLTGGSRTGLARQQTLRAAVDWSYSLLNRAEQSLLQLLSVFAESFDLDAVEGVCCTGGIEVFDVTDLLGSLVDKSLVAAERVGETLRYRLLETIRQFAAERLAEAGEQAAAAAAAEHCAYFLSAAEAAALHLTGPDQGRWLARLDADHANLRHAAEHAASGADGTAQVLRFGVALRRYWLARSRYAEALALLLPVLERPEARTDPRLFGMFEASLQMSRRSGEQTAIGNASLGLACLAADLGDWDRAATLHGVAQAFIDRSGEPWQDLEARYRQDSLAQVRAHLGDERFDQAYGKGQTLRIDEALRSTLRQSAQPDPPSYDITPTCAARPGPNDLVGQRGGQRLACGMCKAPSPG